MNIVCDTHNAYQRCITWKEDSYYLHEEGIIRECPATSCALTSNQYWAAHKIPSRKRHVWSTLAERNFPGFSAGHFQSIDNWLEATRRDRSTCCWSSYPPQKSPWAHHEPLQVASCQTRLLTNFTDLQTNRAHVWAASQNEEMTDMSQLNGCQEKKTVWNVCIEVRNRAPPGCHLISAPSHLSFRSVHQVTKWVRRCRSVK